MDSGTNPFELGLDRLVDLKMDADFIGKEALKKISNKGIKRKQVGLVIDGDPLTGPNSEFWQIYSGNLEIGHVTSAIYSPRLKVNIALAMVNINFSHIGMEAQICSPITKYNAKIVEKPFYDPKKRLTVSQ
jgi:aminomethyltransferase